jgi:hypothetical protein
MNAVIETMKKFLPFFQLLIKLLLLTIILVDIKHSLIVLLPPQFNFLFWKLAPCYFKTSLQYFLHIWYLPYKPGYAKADRQTHDRRQAELQQRRHLQAGQHQHQENDNRHMDDVHCEGMLG